MSLITKPNTFTDGTTGVAAQVNANFDTLYNDYNGNVGSANLAPNLSLPDTQLAQITTASKVSGAAITSINALPSGAGVIPVANLGSGTADSTVFLRGDQTWSSATTTAANALSGSLLQSLTTINTATSAGTTQIPYDDTIPAITEGITCVVDTAITPNNASNLLEITVIVQIATSNGTNMTVALFQDATTAALAVTSSYAATTGQTYTLTLIHKMAAGTTSSTTFRARAGGSSAGTYTINGSSSGNRVFGGVCNTYMNVKEVKV